MENNRRKSIENICSVLLLHFAIINARKKPFVYVYLKEIYSPSRARINKNKNTEDILIAVHVATLLAQTRKHSLIYSEHRIKDDRWENSIKGIPYL